MIMTILTALGGLSIAVLTGALVAPAEQWAVPAVSPADWSVRAMQQSPSFGRGH